MQNSGFGLLCRWVCLSVGLGALGGTAIAYDNLKEDYATCTTGAGKVDNKAVVSACTRLIDNANTENEVIGFFYAMRAIANDDKASNCRDAKKVLKLTDDPTFVNGAKQIMKSNC